MMSKAPSLYVIGKTILGPIFRWYYNPKIIGSENIPKTGSFLITADHIHLYDQCPLIISTKRYITYMAKKEYFDNPKTRWFFKQVGCIPVDRSKKDHEAVESALEVLNNGEAIGLFPEGTRNALKEERVKDIHDNYFNNIDYEEFKSKLFKKENKLSQIKYLLKLFDEKVITKKELNGYIYTPDASIKELVEKGTIEPDEYFKSLLLDFKFGAVKMAKDTDSYIVPVGISGKYKFRSKNLKIRIGKPFKVTDMDLEDANKLLFESIKQLIELNMDEE